ncbi:MAG TPA: HIT domain-containing protein [Acidimicrobiales bacterium]|nr:HIT domain-containing protein [Acidimicrobiales bacterium]
MEDFYCERVLNGIEAVEVVFEDAEVVAYHHTRPFWADAHVVVVPKRHVDSLLDPAVDPVLPALLAVIRDVAAALLSAHGAVRVLTNLGRYQDSKHLHWHVAAGPERADGGHVPRSLTGAERTVRPLGES